MDAPSEDVISLSDVDPYLMYVDVVLFLCDVVVVVCCHCCCCCCWWCSLLVADVEDEDDVGEQVFVHSSCSCA